MDTLGSVQREPLNSSTSSSGPSIHDLLARISVPEFDWNAFEGTYKGRALITRLYHVSSLILSNSSSNSSNPSPESIQLARTALQRLLPLLKSTWDTSLYLRVATLLEDTRGGSLHKPRTAAQGEDEVMEDGSRLSIPTIGGSARGDIDQEWVQGVREAERKETGKLDVELRGYMSNLIKESIRLTYLAFAQLSLKSGRSNDTLKSYALAREYSTSPAHHVELGVGILDTLLAFNQTTTLAGHISKLEAALDRAYPPPVAAVRLGNDAAAAATANLTAADVRDNQEKEARSAEMRRNVGVKLRVAKGLDALGKRELERAGREMGEVGEEGGLAGWEGQAISTGDIALITALCTLATSKRDRIRRVLLDRTSFRSAVDDSQGWVIDLVRAFMDAKYGQVNILLEKAEPYLLLNPFLSHYVRDLISLIQTRAVVQYVAPFSSVKIEIMAKAFDRNVGTMLYEVEGLVKDGRIQGRIDLIDGVLEMKQVNARAELFKDAMGVAKSTTKNGSAALLRMRLHEAGFNVDPRPPAEAYPSQGQKLNLGPSGSGSGVTGSMAVDGFEMKGGSGSGSMPGEFESGSGMDDVQMIR